MKYLSLIFIFIFALSAHAATFTVTRTDDRNGTCNSGVDCSLREAVNAANVALTDDVINFNSDLSKITLTNEIVINNVGTLTINGTGANILTIDGGEGTNRIFYTNNATSTITRVTLTGGNAAGTSPNLQGGAILANRGTLVLDSVYITENSVSGGTGGGVYYSSGTGHQIRNSTFSDNTALYCGGFFNAGGTLIVINSTISRNTAVSSYGGTGGAGGGFCSSIGPTASTTTLRNVTVTDNSAGGQGGGFYSDSGRLNLGNTIVAGNTARTDPDISYIYNYFYDAVTTAGYNLIGNNTGAETIFSAGNPNANNDIVGTSAAPINPMLGPLVDNNGTNRIPTHAVPSDSPATDKGFSFGLSTDQRGLIRPGDNLAIPNAIGGDGSDIGAFEFQVAVLKSRKRTRFF
jgi:CSLREA domain-containing protein